MIGRWRRGLRRALRRDANRAAFLRVAGVDNRNLRLLHGTCRRHRPVILPLRGTILCRKPGSRGVIDQQRAAITTELIAARTLSGRCSGGLDGDRTDGCPRNGGDAFRFNSPVDKTMIMIAHVEVVDHRGLVENLRHLSRRQTTAAGMRVAKILGGNEGETILAQPPVEADADGTAAVIET